MSVIIDSKGEATHVAVNEDENEDAKNHECFDESSPLKPPTETKTTNEEKAPVETKQEAKKKKLTFREKLKEIKDNTTVEPIMGCYVIPSILASLAIQNLNLEKACRVNLNYTNEVCDALTLRQTENYTIYEDEVQRLITKIQAWKNIIQTTVPVMLILFVGAWSDKTGKRKACILIPILGEFLSCIGFILNTYFFYELPVEVAMFTESIFPALTGGWFTNFIGVFSYISDITTTENRTYRVGMVNMLMSLGYPIGSALSGVILSWVGYYGVFMISGSMYLFSLLYGYFALEEPRKKSKVQKELQTKPNRGFFREFFDIALVSETFKVVFKKGERNRRLRVCLLLVCVMVIFGPLNGEFTVLYLFTRYRFNWNEVQYSAWSTYAIATNTLGTYFSITLFTRYLKMDDTLLCIISITSKIVASFAYAFARTNLEIYLACLLEILNGTSFIAMRSIATKLVDGEEFGKVNSLFGVAEAMTPLVYGPLYSQVYSATLKILPGAVFLMGSLLILPAVGILTWLYFQNKKDLLLKTKDLESDAEKQQDLPLK